ncbi:MAG TPA: HAD-IA family hydrolase, partial [Gaiellaceae bacterium]|nr:HAD-IA family hydrolase [Gaiellaceae bacterium]
MDRWATFDCYGTLVDWNAGIYGQLARIFGEGRADQLLLRYHELEPRVEAETPTARYREVMAEVMRRLGAPEEEQDALGRSLPDWPVFPEVPAALAEARSRGWRLAALSNTDREFIDASIRALGVPFDEAVVASEIGSYKPAHGHWEEFFRRTGADRAGHVHVAQSHFHDVVPATELGLRSVWINRLAERREPAPTR